MKKNLSHYLRLIGAAAILAVMIGLLILVIGLLAGWRTNIQFSNGFFIAGSITIVLGLVSIIGGFNMRSDFRVLYSQSAGEMGLAERTRRWAADITQGYGVVILLTLTGLLLIGIAVLVGSTAG